MATSIDRLIGAAELVSQGAEAKVYKARLSDTTAPILLKYRFPKKYRHPTLTAQLTRSRVTSEARALVKCARSGVNVPNVRLVNLEAGVIGIDWIEGRSLRSVLGGGEEAGEEPANHSPLHVEDTPELWSIDSERVMRLVGVELGKMHKADIIHGDLTTSNMMLKFVQDAKEPQVVLIDFGLSFQSSLVEDKAVDLYVLERAFASTHPQSEPLFQAVLSSYAEELGGKAWDSVKRRLEDVRLRGRKRSMLGWTGRLFHEEAYGMSEVHPPREKKYIWEDHNHV